MHSALLAAYALCSLPLLLQPQDFLSDVSWPTHAVIAVPRGSIKPTDQLFILENDLVDLTQPDVAFLQAVGDRVRRKRWIVLLAGEALLLRRGDDAAVLDQRRRAVVIERREAEDTHGRD